MNHLIPIKLINRDHVDRVVDVLCEVFYEYPVMRYVLGNEGVEFNQQFPKLIRLFVMGRVLKNGPLFGIGDADLLDAATVIALPETRDVPESLIDLRRTTWQELGQAAYHRYDDFCEACEPFDPKEPHHHLSMIGVRDGYQGKGYGRLLMEHVISLSDRHEQSAGVSLSTENPSTVPFYQRLGFEITGRTNVGPGLDTWSFFRAKG
jgi:GNAT superfamily N-acetyltransferase